MEETEIEKEIEIANISETEVIEEPISNYFKKTEPVLYIIMNNELETNELDYAKYLVNITTDFHKTIGYNEATYIKMKQDPENHKTFDNTEGKWTNYLNWLANRKIKIVKLTPEQIEELFGILLVDNQSSDVVLDTYTDDNYVFSVENRSIAKMLIKSNENITIVGEKQNGRVLLKKPEQIGSFAFTYDCIPTIENYLLERTIKCEATK